MASNIEENVTNASEERRAVSQFFALSVAHNKAINIQDLLFKTMIIISNLIYTFHLGFE